MSLKQCSKSIITPTHLASSTPCLLNGEVSSRTSMIRVIKKVSAQTHLFAFSFNKFTSVAARAVRSSYKEDLRVAAEKRGLTSVRYQTWENGVGGAQVCYVSAFIYLF